MNLDDLLGVGDVEPVPVSLPAFRDNLNEDASHRWLWNVGDALHVGLDVDFGLFVFDQTILLRFEIDAGVFDGLVGVAAGDFDSETWNGCWSGRLFWRRGLLRGRGSAYREKEKSKAS